jgi:hypothetical protein
MERSATDANARAAPPKPQPYFIVMGSIPATDEDFLAWKEDYCLGRSVRDSMIAYVEHRNLKGKELYDQQEEKYEAYLQSLKQAEQQTKSKVKDEPQSTFTLQIIPSPQNIVSTLSDQSQPPEHCLYPFRSVLSPENCLFSSRTSPSPDHSFATNWSASWPN